MKAWSAYLAWFAGLKQREQKIVALAVLAGGLFLGYTYGIEPALLKAQRDGRAAAEARTALATVQQQMQVFQSLNRDPDAPLRTRLEQVKGEFAAQAERFAAVEKSLVPPERMPALLESFLGRGNALQLVSLRTLPPVPLIDRRPATETRDRPIPAVGPAAATAAAIATGAPNIYRHGMELKLTGSYPELMSYLRALEASPQRLLLGRMELTTLEYPRSQLTLTVHTLSLEASWLKL